MKHIGIKVHVIQYTVHHRIQKVDWRQHAHSKNRTTTVARLEKSTRGPGAGNRNARNVRHLHLDHSPRQCSIKVQSVVRNIERSLDQ